MEQSGRIAEIKFEKNSLVKGFGGRPMATDIFYLPGERRPVVIYLHGFNGFKDWGNFDLIASQFAAAGFAFIKFNSSHNGTSVAHPESFDDLEAYSRNNYSIELSDLETMVDWATSPQNPHRENIDPGEVYLLGHSRGGGIAILESARDRRVKKLATWASVSECKTPWGSWSQERIREWEKTGTAYILNSRTNQQMPLGYQLFTDYQQHAQRLDIGAAMASLDIPVLICHGLTDQAVPVEKAHQLHKYSRHAELFLVESDHVFGRKHPWPSDQLPPAMRAVVTRTIQFYKQEIHINEGKG